MINEIDLYKERLNKLLELLENNNLNPFLICGTLLGYYREHQPISSDYKDIDIALRKEDYWKFRQLIDAQTDFVYYRIWPNEIALHYKDRKIDVFFLESDTSNNTYIYSYKYNSFTSKWDTEWRSIFKTSDFYPLERVDYPFLNRKANIPHNTINILNTHYGDWKTPNSKWSINDMTNIDIYYRQIAFIIPEFLRHEKTQACVDSIYKIFPRDWFRIYIGNQDGHKRPAYLHSDDKYFMLENNAGLAKTRQFLINNANEPYVLIMDNDFLFTKESNLNTFLQILLDKQEHGIVGGQLRNYNNKPIYSYLYNLNYTAYPKIQIEKEEIQPIFLSTFSSKSQSKIQYAYADLILNFSLMKKEIFKKIQYDENFKLVEHLDFFLRLKQANICKVCFTQDIYANHQPEDNSEKYIRYRNSKNGINVHSGYEVFNKKWGVHPKEILIKKQGL